MAFPTPPDDLESPPDPAPSRKQPDSFAERSDALAAWYITARAWFNTFKGFLSSWVTELNTVQGDITTKHGDVTTKHGEVQTWHGEVEYAATVVSSAAGVNGTSASVRTPAAGSMTFVYVETGKTPPAGANLRAASRANPTLNYAYGVVTAYDSGTRTVTISVTSDGVGPSPASASDWNLILEAQPGATGNDGEDAYNGTPFGSDISGAVSVAYDDWGTARKASADTTITPDTPSALTNGWNMFLEAIGGAITINATFGDGKTSKIIPRGACGYLACNGTNFTLAVYSLERKFGAAGSPVVVSSNNSQNHVAVAGMTSTRALVAFKGATGYINVSLVSETGAVLATQQVQASTGNQPEIKRVSDTKAVILWYDGTNAKCAIITYSGTTITVSSVLTLSGANTSALVSLAVLSASVAVVALTNSVPAAKLYALDISGAAPTETGVTTVTGTTYNVWRVAALNATQIVVFAAVATAGVMSAVAATVYTVSGATFTAGGNLIAAYHGTNDTASALTAYGDCANAGTNTVVWAGGTAASANGRGKAVLLEVSGTGASAVLTLGAPADVPPAQGSGTVHRTALAESGTLLRAGLVESGGLVLDALFANGGLHLQRSPSSVAVARSVSNGGFDVAVLGTNAIVAYADGANSHYTTVRAIALGSIT